MRSRPLGGRPTSSKLFYPYEWLCPRRAFSRTQASYGAAFSPSPRMRGGHYLENRRTEAWLIALWVTTVFDIIYIIRTTIGRICDGSLHKRPSVYSTAPARISVWTIS